MNDRDALCIVSADAKSRSIVRRFWLWWRSQDPEQQYLAAATDLADLERRMRVLERGSGAQVFVTFNH